ncbi:RHS repeat-associated core domain-containing protein [Pseudomonas fulva]|uniref:RHS repeat-associated core domain-containing protein n=1 Tax=Pseudomonas TaxID=286 RepID=UPI00119E2665|nr:RHS repeat-associated core domain-containing protein [Pseudomonas sp. URMO17WK12:I11]
MSKAPNSSLLFYQGNKLSTVREDAVTRTILRGAEAPLAEQLTGATTTAGLLTTDDKGSVLSVLSDDEEPPHSYSAYGHDPTLPSTRVATGFNGEALEPTARCYLLGQGYRAYSPSLGRFIAADSLSPFGEGGLNSYAYCTNDPVNAVDPSGHVTLVIEIFKQIKRQPTTTVIRLTAGSNVPPSTKIVKQGNSKYYSKTWQPDTLYRYETRTLNRVPVNQDLGGGKGAILKENLARYKANEKDLRTLQTLQDLLPTEAGGLHLNTLVEQQRGMLNEGGRLLKSALDPQDLTTHIRGNPRTTQGE